MTRTLLRSWYSRALVAGVVVLVVVVVVNRSGSSDERRADVAPIAAPVARNPAGAVRGTMLLVHGGSWRGSDPREQSRLLREPGEVFLARSWRVVSVDYSAGKGGLRDVLAAIAGQRGRGGRPLCVYGESAGGHLALVAAARRAPVDCVIAAAPPTDLQAYLATAADGSNGVHRAVAGIIRRTFGATPAATAPWEPLRLAGRIVADVLLLRVSNDPLVPREQMDRFVRVRPSTRFVELEKGDLADPTQAWVHGALSPRGRRVLRSTLARFVDCTVGEPGGRCQPQRRARNQRWP